MFSLRGKCALVTGGSRGIGAATSRALARLGADVMLGYHSRHADAERLVAELRAMGVRAAAHASDISTEAGADSLVAATVQELGALDLFVANAGIWPVEEAAIAEMATDRWRRTMVQNLDSTFFTCRAAARAMRDGGRVVVVSSTAGQRGESYHGDYAATKGAVISLVKGVALELAGRGITVNCVAPGWVDTEMCAEPYADGGREKIARAIPVGRVASADDIAAPIAFLCTAEARHITGEVVNVNGGSVLCG
jgi:3-oxoacyl-[acyl-carrier protein] reductase